MATPTLFDTGIFSVIGLSSELLVGAELHWFEAGTSTPAVTYSDPALTTANSNPVLTDAAGRLPEIWLGEGSFKYVLVGPGGSLSTPLVTVDGYRPVANYLDDYITDLADPTGSTLVGYQAPYSNTVPTTVADAAAREVSVDDFGAVGDGVTNDSVTIQTAIDTLSTIYMTTGQPQTLRFTDGKTYVLRLVYMKPGVNYIGNGGARLLKTPAGTEHDENVLKNWRMLTSPNDSSWRSDAACAHRILIQGLIFDGNLANMNWTNNSFNQEQAHCLMFYVSSPTSATQQMKAHVDNCVFINSVADGLSQYINTDVIATNIVASNCFRGGLVSTGGNSKLVVRNYVGENARVDFEVDGAGYGASFISDVNIDGVVVDRGGGGIRPGGADLGTYLGTNSRFTGRNIRIYTAPCNWSAGGGIFNIDDSYFANGPFSAVSGRVLYCNGEVIFRNTEFYTYNSDSLAAAQYCGIQVRFDETGTTPNGKLVVFQDCLFSVDPALVSAGKEVFGILNASNIQGNGNWVSIINGTFNAGLTASFYGIQGGNFRVRGGITNAATAMYLDYSGSTRYFTLEVDDLTVGPSCTRWLGTNSVIAAAGNSVSYKNLTIPLAASAITTRAGAATGDIANISGGRTIIGSTVPPSANSYRGDIYKLLTPAAGKPYEWIATHAGYSAAGTWAIRSAAVAKNTTANRPTLTASDIFCPFMDTTLDADGKPIWWNGTAWVDATGAVV